MYKIISYTIKQNNPRFSVHPSTEFKSFFKLEDGDICNAHTIKLFSHNDTHIDSPYHYNPNGFKVDEIKPEDFFYNNVAIVKLNKIGKEIGIDDIKDVLKPDTDMLLIYTGLNDYWFDEPEKFGLKENQPWLSVELANYLINKTNLRTVGIDFGCVDSMEDIEKMNPIVHKTLLGANEISKVIFIIENVNIIPVLNDNVIRLFSFPIQFFGLDGGPVTMVAEV